MRNDEFTEGITLLDKQFVATSDGRETVVYFKDREVANIREDAEKVFYFDFGKVESVPHIGMLIHKWVVKYGLTPLRDRDKPIYALKLSSEQFLGWESGDFVTRSYPVRFSQSSIDLMQENMDLNFDLNILKERVN